MDDDPATQQNVTIEEIDGKKRFLYAQYQRSPHYRVIYCDGALGTVTNNGSLHCAIFSDHPTIPTKVYQEVEEDGNKNLNIIGTPEPADNDSLLTRELESMLVMNIETAKSLYGWLGRRINEYDQKLKNENDNNQA